MDFTPPLKPGTLWTRVVKCTARALETGALQPVRTRQETVDDGGVLFLLRVVEQLAEKDRQRDPNETGAPGQSPFLPPEPDLAVADIPPGHVAVLNKFNVLDHHLLIVTREFAHQEELLDESDIHALLRCLNEFPSLGFYNGGEIAGASQPHKHLQLVPLPLGDGPFPIPIEAVLPRDNGPGTPVVVPAMPFPHRFVRFAEPAGAAQTREITDLYRQMLAEVGIRGVRHNDTLRQSAPYNLLVTRDWMLIVPRASEFHGGISVNGLGFAGSLFVRTRELAELVRSVGPMRILTAVAGLAPSTGPVQSG